ncbi:MAG TPA: type I-C CRISPR-associated protein Cas8c/Csd1 [Burkholderiaceae bacterium]|nr:type I-C CRISPR-associated protein Cas8c/Csd1 [Burkholderiaceae bacterium]
MILQELVRYYDRKSRDPDPAQRLPNFGLEDKEIPFVIELAADGRVVQLRDTRSLEGKKLRAKSFLVPQGVKKTSAVAANLLWDSAAYAIGLDKSRKSKAEVTPHAAFRARIEALPEAAKADAGPRAVLAALDRADWSVLQGHPAWAEIQETGPVMTFQLSGDVDLICQRPAVAAAALPMADADAKPGLCLVEGVCAPIQRLHSAIKGVWGAQSSGANIVSFNARAFESYGKGERQGENAPVGERAAFAYTTALNHLLAKDSRNRVQVGDASTVFWADTASRFDSEFTLADFFGETKDDPDRGVRAVQALHQALASGQLPVGERDAQFFVLGLAPNAARISVRFWMRAPLSELAPRILQHFADLKVARRYDSDSTTPSLFRLLSSVALLGKLDNAPPRLAGEWMRAILEGQPYPATLLNAAVIRCKAEREVTTLRAAVLKAWLNRDHRRGHPAAPAHLQHFKEELDMQQTDVPYLLGRLFAVLERIQQQAQPGINATIRDRYYGAASTTPVSVFTTLLRLKNAHLKKLGDGQTAHFERLIGDILLPLTDFPRQLALPQQAKFALGYYHQRQAFFTRKEEASADNTPPAQET